MTRHTYLPSPTTLAAVLWLTVQAVCCVSAVACYRAASATGDAGLWFGLLVANVAGLVMAWGCLVGKVFGAVEEGEDDS